MTEYRIAQVADRTGFPASTLRFYEDIGLVKPSGRRANGYRVYDDAAILRLRFVARAKRLGLGLEPIADLLALFDAEECAPVQERLRCLLDEKCVELDDQIAELRDFRRELHAVANRLQPGRLGGCDDQCGCLDDGPTATTAVAVTIGRRDPSGPTTAPPIACTLGPADIDERLTQWHQLAATAIHRRSTPRGVRLTFAADADIEAITRLVTAERQCCAWLACSLELRPDAIGLEITAPDDTSRVLVDALLGA